MKNKSYDEQRYESKLIVDMKSSGCLIDDNVKYDTTIFGLTIAPTLDCNFRCKYCFETHPKGIMSPEIQAALLKFAENKLARAKNFSVTWYGGEPLLAKKIVYASLIRGAQITIDGVKEIHDSRRRSITGASTFDRLIECVNLLLNGGLSAIVRINIDKENLARVDELLDILAERIDKRDKLKIDFGQVSPFTEICKSIESDCYNNEQFADVMLPLYEKVLSRGFTVNKMAAYPGARVNFCCVDYVNSFVVDNRGELYRCWNHVGNLKHSSGNVNVGDELVLEKNYLSWIQWNPIKHAKCRECACLPLCMGGCPDAMRNSSDGQPVCGTVKYNLDKVLNHYYDRLKGDV